LGAGLLSYVIEDKNEYPVLVTYLQSGEKKQIRAKFIVGADGSHSLVAKLNPVLSQNRRFLAGHEKVFYGEITFGEHSDNTIYHFWFGEFSLGYGGWLSPTFINGKKAFRLGLAKLSADSRDLKRIDEFISILVEKQIIRIDGDPNKPVVGFGHLIPIGGVLPHVYDKHTLLIGDAAGLCGAFAADGIKGAVVSGIVGAELVNSFINGDQEALKTFYPKIQKYSHLMTYYRKQLLYRFLWDRMKSNRSFHLLYELIAAEKESFLYQFCDSKDRQKSLVRVVLKLKNVFKLTGYAFSLLLDFFV
jgi:geranylgeranyl reductase